METLKNSDTPGGREQSTQFGCSCCLTYVSAIEWLLGPAGRLHRSATARGRFRPDPFKVLPRHVARGQEFGCCHKRYASAKSGCYFHLGSLRGIFLDRFDPIQTTRFCFAAFTVKNGLPIACFQPEPEFSGFVGINLEFSWHVTCSFQRKMDAYILE